LCANAFRFLVFQVLQRKSLHAISLTDHDH